MHKMAQFIGRFLLYSIKKNEEKKNDSFQLNDSKKLISDIIFMNWKKMSEKCSVLAKFEKT